MRSGGGEIRTTDAGVPGVLLGTLVGRVLRKLTNNNNGIQIYGMASLVNFCPSRVELCTTFWVVQINK